MGCHTYLNMARSATAVGSASDFGISRVLELDFQHSHITLVKMAPMLEPILAKPKMYTYQ